MPGSKPRHGHAAGTHTSPTYRSWKDMKARCIRVTHKDYPHYGGRGITFCERWRVFDNFLADMGERPEGMTLERNDNDGPYSASNCRWATRAEQCRNQRSNLLLTHEGRTMCVADWAAHLGIHRQTLRDRIQRYGWSTERALTTPT